MKFQPSPKTFDAVSFEPGEDSQIVFSDRPTWLIDSIMTGRVWLQSGSLTIRTPSSVITAQSGYLTDTLHVYEPMSFEALFDEA